MDVTDKDCEDLLRWARVVVLGNLTRTLLLLFAIRPYLSGLMELLQPLLGPRPFWVALPYNVLAEFNRAFPVWAIIVATCIGGASWIFFRAHSQRARQIAVGILLLEFSFEIVLGLSLMYMHSSNHLG